MWAKGVGVTCGPMAPGEKDSMIQELDAVAALLYGLSQEQVTHVYETFHEGWDYEERLRETLKHFKSWSKKQ